MLTFFHEKVEALKLSELNAPASSLPPLRKGHKVIQAPILVPMSITSLQGYT
jgi:hypothetical protein